MKLVISVSGGGALGIGPLQFMRRLEADLGKKLGDVCAAFAGTSTGSIIASGLCSGMSADELYGMYNDNLSAIFTKRKGVVVPELASNYYRYDNANLKKLLYKYFPGKMDTFGKPIFIPTTFMNGESVEKVWNREDSWMDSSFQLLGPDIFRYAESRWQDFLRWRPVGQRSHYGAGIGHQEPLQAGQEGMQGNHR